MKYLLQKILSTTGYSLSKIDSRRFPIEASQVEVDIINFVLNNNYTMLGVERLYAALSAVRYTIENNIEGDFVECGVWRGGCSLAMAMYARHLGSNKKVYLLDTFAGMTSPGINDKETGSKNNDKLMREYQKGQKDGYNEMSFASLDDVVQIFRNEDLVTSAEFIKGDVINTLNDDSWQPQNYSIVRLDTDFYDSTFEELMILYPRLTKSGVLLIDDYGHYEGAQKAVDEYFENHSVRKPLKLITDYTGRAIIKI